MLTYDFNVWIEASMIPFLAVMSAFLFFRYKTNALINVRFRLLVLSAFFALLLEVLTSLLVDGLSHSRNINLALRSLYYLSLYINAYCLMRYVQAFVNVVNKKFAMFNIFLLLSSFLVVIINLIPPYAGFFFTIPYDGGLIRGPYNALWKSVYVFYFIVMACWLQVTNKKYYTASSQYMIMNILGIFLCASYIIQYMIFTQILITHVVQTLVIFVTFFYYEAPTYRRMLSVEQELEISRTRALQSANLTNAANRAKSDFLANTSHEIRTPMNAILGMNEMMLKETKDADIRKASLDIRKAGTNLLSIINNILDISKIESGKMELYNADYHIYNMLKDIEDANYEIMNEKGIKFILDIDKTLPEHLYGDEDHIRQVIMNLIDNAIKYTQKGTITLSIRGTRKPHDRVKLIISVEDTGIGIRNEDIEKLFRSFERVNLNETQSISGAGLGLTLVRYLLELMGGNIRAESEYGRGTKFTLELTQQLAQEGFQGDISEYEVLQNSQSLSMPEKRDERIFTCPEARILIVDDTPVNLVVAKGMLKESEAEVNTSESGEEALELLKANHYDIIFLDHKMPGLDGIQTLNQAKELDGPSRLSVYIALTANSGSGLREEYISYGFNDYLPKPIKSEALKKILSRYIPENLKQYEGEEHDK